MQIVESKTREKFPISYRKVVKKTISDNLILLGALMLPLGFLGVLAKSFLNVSVANVWLIATGLIVTLFIFSLGIFLYHRWYFADYFYAFDETTVTIKEGVFTPMEVIIPYEKIRDIYIDQDLWDRIFGIYDVHFSGTTVSSGIEAHIDGLERKVAEELKNELLGLIQRKTIVDNSVEIETEDDLSAEI